MTVSRQLATHSKKRLFTIKINFSSTSGQENHRHQDKQHIPCTHPRRRGNIERGVRCHKQANDGFRTRANFMEIVQHFLTFPRIMSRAMKYGLATQFWVATHSLGPSALEFNRENANRGEFEFEVSEKIPAKYAPRNTNIQAGADELERKKESWGHTL